MPVIKDCALALGARYGTKPVGSLGVLSIVSFYATKVITTGEGGMVLGNRAGFIEEVRDLRSYDGRSRHQKTLQLQDDRAPGCSGQGPASQALSFRGPQMPWCINTGKSLIPLTLRFFAQNVTC